MKRTRLQPFSYGLYIDLSGLPDRYRDLARLDAKKSRVSMRFIYSSTRLSMWQMFSCQSSPILIWSEDDRLTLSYYRLISKYLTPVMKEEKAELEVKHILVFGERYPASNRAMRQAHGAEDSYSIYYKEREKEEMEEDIACSQWTNIPKSRDHICFKDGREYWSTPDGMWVYSAPIEAKISVHHRLQARKELGTRADFESSVPFYIDPIHSTSYYAPSTLGRLGGLVKSEAKSTASRVNGKKGGRPKSTKSIDMGDI